MSSWIINEWIVGIIFCRTFLVYVLNSGNIWIFYVSWEIKYVELKNKKKWKNLNVFVVRLEKLVCVGLGFNVSRKNIALLTWMICIMKWRNWRIILRKLEWWLLTDCLSAIKKYLESTVWIFLRKSLIWVKICKILMLLQFIMTSRLTYLIWFKGQSVNALLSVDNWTERYSYLSVFFIYSQLIYHSLGGLYGRQNGELLDRVQSSKLCLIFLGMISELIII